MEQEPTPRQRALDLFELVIPAWQPTATHLVWTIRITIVLSILLIISYLSGITFWDLLRISVFPAAVAVGTLILNQAADKRERARGRERALNEERRDLLMRLTRAYNDTKKVRRILKAHIVTIDRSEKEISCTVYEEQLRKLIDVQLEFELYKRYPTGAVSPFLSAFKSAESISMRLTKVEEDLNHIINEYDGGRYQQEKQKVRADGSCRIPLKGLPTLAKFLERNSFIEGFRDKFRATAKEIQEEIKRETGH